MGTIGFSYLKGFERLVLGKQQTDVLVVDPRCLLKKSHFVFFTREDDVGILETRNGLLKLLLGTRCVILSNIEVGQFSLGLPPGKYLGFFVFGDFLKQIPGSFEFTPGDRDPRRGQIKLRPLSGKSGDLPAMLYGLLDIAFIHGYFRQGILNTHHKSSPI